MAQQLGAGCPRCGNALIGDLACPLCGWNRLVETWLPRLREAIQSSSYECAVAHQGRKRWMVSLELVDASQFAWGIRVEEAVGKTLVRTDHHATLRLALTHHPGLTERSGWQPLVRRSAPTSVPWAANVLNLDE